LFGEFEDAVFEGVLGCFDVDLRGGAEDVDVEDGFCDCRMYWYW